MPDRGLLINELFGPTWQGEGRQTGRRCFFVRTSTCNLECSWCDTPQTWVFSERKVEKHGRIDVPFDVKKEQTRMTPGEIGNALIKQGYLVHDLIVISGGEPLLQQEGLQQFIYYMHKHKREWAIETAGTIIPSSTLQNKIGQWVVSPKLAGSGNALEKRYNSDAIQSFNELMADFKFVVTDQYDMMEVEDFVIKHGIPTHRVWIMPEGVTQGAVIDNARRLLEFTQANNFNLTLRQHILLFGDERGH